MHPNWGADGYSNSCANHRTNHSANRANFANHYHGGDPDGCADHYTKHCADRSSCANRCLDGGPNRSSNRTVCCSDSVPDGFSTSIRRPPWQ